jgi:hypothetical protein
LCHSVPLKPLLSPIFAFSSPGIPTPLHRNTGFAEVSYCRASQLYLRAADGFFATLWNKSGGERRCGGDQSERRKLETNAFGPWFLGANESARAYTSLLWTKPRFHRPFWPFRTDETFSLVSHLRIAFSASSPNGRFVFDFLSIIHFIRTRLQVTESIRPQIVFPCFLDSPDYGALRTNTSAQKHRFVGSQRVILSRFSRREPMTILPGRRLGPCETLSSSAAGWAWCMKPLIPSP